MTEPILVIVLTKHQTMFNEDDDLLPEELDLIEQEGDEDDDFDAIDKEWFEQLDNMKVPSCNMDDPDECLNCGS